MKPILFLFTAGLLLLACSNNDDSTPAVQQTDFKIKSFSRYLHFENSSEDYELERLFDEDGQSIRENEIYSDLTLYWLYSYNDLDVISEKINFYGDGTSRRSDIFAYDSNKKIDSITYKNGDGDILSVIHYTHEENKSTYHHSSIYGEIYYNSEGAITKNYVSGDTGTSTQTIEYAADNITKISTVQSNGRTETYLFQYDDGINPLYDCVQNHYFNATIGDHISLFDRLNYFSKNNFTQITYTSSEAGADYIKTKTTEYNDSGYPTSAVIKKDDVLIEELAYEYY